MNRVATSETLERLAITAGIPIVDIGEDAFEELCPAKFQPRPKQSSCCTKKAKRQETISSPSSKPCASSIPVKSHGDVCGDCGKKKIWTSCDFCCTKLCRTCSCGPDSNLCDACGRRLGFWKLSGAGVWRFCEAGKALPKQSDRTVLAFMRRCFLYETGEASRELSQSGDPPLVPRVSRKYA